MGPEFDFSQHRDSSGAQQASPGKLASESKTLPVLRLRLLLVHLQGLVWLQIVPNVREYPSNKVPTGINNM